MTDKKNPLFRNALLGGIVGSISVLAIVALTTIVGCWFDYKAIVVVNQTQLQEKMDMVTVPEQMLLRSLEHKGILLTPAEYTNNIIGYYNTLIAFLAIFFIVFTFASYMYIKGMSKKEVRDEAREILLDSETFRRDVLDTIRGEFDNNYIPREEFDRINNVTDEKLEHLMEVIEDNKNLSKKKTVVKKISK